MLKTFKFIPFIVCCLLLSACGFHLRGKEALPPQLTSIYIDAAPYDPLTIALKQTLQSAGVKIVKSAKQSPVTLQILSEQTSQKLASISANTLVKTYQLQYVVSIQLLNSAGTIIYGPVDVTSQTTYYASDNQILGDTTQLTSVQQSLEQEAIGLIFNRLSSQDARVALIKNAREIKRK